MLGSERGMDGRGESPVVGTFNGWGVESEREQPFPRPRPRPRPQLSDHVLINSVSPEIVMSDDLDTEIPAPGYRPDPVGMMPAEVVKRGNAL